MPTMVSGASSTATVNTAAHVRDVSERLAELDPNVAPFTLMLAAARSEVADNFKFEWFEKERAPKYDLVNGAQTAGDTSIEVDNGAYFSVGNIVKNPRTGEVFRVTGIATNTLTVARGVGSTAAAAMNDNDDLFIIGSSHAEGADVPTPKDHQEVEKYNYTEIFRTALGATRTQQNTRNYIGKTRTRQRLEKMREHKIDMESAFLFGERNRDTSTAAAPRNYTGGFTYWATENAKDANGTLTEPEIWDWCEDLFNATASGDTKTLFASPLVVSVIDMLAGARLQTVPSDKTYGIAVRQLLTSHGTLLVVKHRLLRNGASGNGYGNMAFAVQPKELAFRYLANSNTQLLIDRQSPGTDGYVDEYLTEAGLEFRLPGVHGILSDVTG